MHMLVKQLDLLLIDVLSCFTIKAPFPQRHNIYDSSSLLCYPPSDALRAITSLRADLPLVYVRLQRARSLAVRCYLGMHSVLTGRRLIFDDDPECRLRRFAERIVRFAGVVDMQHTADKWIDLQLILR